MALTLPLYLFDTVYKCAFSDEASSSAASTNRLAEYLIANVSLLEAIRLRQVSRSFKKAGDQRLRAFKQIEIKVYKNLHKIYNHECDRGELFMKFCRKQTINHCKFNFF